MDFTLSPKVVQLQKRVSDFMNAHVYPIENRVEDEMNVHGKEHVEPEILKEVRKKAKAAGLWNLFMPDEDYGKGLKVSEYAPLSEIMGRRPIGSRAFNCMAPDTGNMEILADFGTAEQKKRWLEPCLEGDDAHLLLDDRAGDRRLRPDPARDARGARRRLLQYQRAQVVHLERDRSRLRDRDGGDRPDDRAA